MDNRPEQSRRLRAAVPGDGVGMAQVLVVDLPQTTLDRLAPNVLRHPYWLRLARFDDIVTADLSGAAAPGLILSPLVTPAFDALDMARVLDRQGYPGRYLALVGSLPSAPLVRREVAAQCPGVNFDVVVLDGRTPLHLL